ncbi:hypothetical protein Y032_0069g328 [Ancylostoma ceylanicum]|uniref:LUC7 protein n=1 Tax=Ancylostoma ceylanicum TaxID=53326 RepID=A0A016TXZ9_9BILA|nr:hypothetical protein Y032_0069g328 [Ancylostoma ceylanicum]
MLCVVMTYCLLFVPHEHAHVMNEALDKLPVVLQNTGTFADTVLDLHTSTYSLAMSARNAMAAMLDELMGPKRNVELGKDTKVTFDDPDICKYYIVGFCPHDMFVNTKADLGACPRVHDDNLRLEYPKSDKFEKLGFEREFLKFLSRLDEDNQRRIRKNLEKLKANEENGQKKEDLRKLRDEQEIARIDGEIKLCMAEAEKAGEEGLVTKCQELVDKIEQLEKQKTAVEERLNNTATIPPPIDESAIKVMEVCEVCGSMLIKNDAQCRVEEHLSGKMHMGFSKIKVTIEELRERIRKRDEENEKERQKLREERERRKELILEQLGTIFFFDIYGAAKSSFLSSLALYFSLIFTK